MIFPFDVVGIIKYPCRIVEGNSVFGEVLCRFAGIPFEGHALIVWVTRRNVKYCNAWLRACARNHGEVQSHPMPKSSVLLPNHTGQYAKDLLDVSQVVFVSIDSPLLGG